MRLLVNEKLFLKGCENGIASVKKNAPDAEIVEVE